MSSDPEILKNCFIYINTLNNKIKCTVLCHIFIFLFSFFLFLFIFYLFIYLFFFFFFAGRDCYLIIGVFFYMHFLYDSA